MISFPNAKINLGLNIIARRPDGYHAIESCFYPIPWQDCLEIVASNQLAFETHGLDIPGNAANNLCLKAYHLLQKDFALPPVKIHLLKAIPMGGGLGGGSADGAEMLKLLNKTFHLKIDDKQLEAYALQLGSDCPFFVRNQPAIASGRGEQLQPIDLDLSDYWIALENPGVHISTREAYSNVVPSKPTIGIADIIKSPLETWRDTLVNDFEESVFPRYSAIKVLKDRFYQQGAVYASMTGSGSTVFGIFREKPIAEKRFKL